MLMRGPSPPASRASLSRANREGRALLAALFSGVYVLSMAHGAADAPRAGALAAINGAMLLLATRRVTVTRYCKGD